MEVQNYDPVEKLSLSKLAFFGVDYINPELKCGILFIKPALKKEKNRIQNVAILNSFVLCLEALGKWQGVYLKAIGLYRSGETEQKGLF